MWLAARSFSPRSGGESEIEGLGERKPPKLQISQVRGSVTQAPDQTDAYRPAGAGASA